MNLRFGIRALLAGPRRTCSLLLLAGALLVLVPFAGRAEAGVGDYPSPLYLAGPPSAVTGHGASYRLVGSLSPAPTTSVSAGASSLSATTYRYVYSVETGGVEGAYSAGATATVTTAGAEQVTVSGLPTGAGVTVRLYRLNVTSPTNCYTRIWLSAADNAQSSFTDTNGGSSCTNFLKRSEDKFPLSTTGWTELSPSTVAPGGLMSSPVIATAPTAPNKKGWIVDGAGQVSFPTGPWTFDVQTRSNAGADPATALLVVAMWKIDAATGNPVGAAILPPTEQVQAPPNLLSATNILQNVSIQVTLPAFSLEANERLYVQFWRHQTTAYTTAGATNRILSMFAWDGLAKISHPAASAFPTEPTPVGPVAGASTVSKSLSAVFHDPESDSGTVEFRLCADAACSAVVDSGSSSSVASGAQATWTSGASLTHGATYYWQARGRDATGGTSGWTAAQSFLVNAAPNTPPLLAPAAGAAVTGLALDASYSDPEGDAGSLTVRICSTEAIEGVECPTHVATGWFNTVVSGETVNWRPALPDGVYHWQARVGDVLGARSAWSATRMVRLDTTPPSAPAEFGAVLGDDGLTLRWLAPLGDEIGSYVVYVDGRQSLVLNAQTLEAKLGPFDSNDARSFSVGAIDTAGNQGARTGTLVGVPDLVGLTRDQARAAVAARGLVLQAESARAMRAVRSDDVVQTQSPEAPSLVATGSKVDVVLVAPAKAAALLRLAKVRASCARLTVQIALKQRARVSVALLNRSGDRITSWRTKALAGGNRSMVLPLRSSVRPGRYSVSVTASAGGRTQRLSMPLRLGRTALSRCAR
jgi:hypothetical protein